MNDDQFTKLFSYIEDFRHEVNDKFEQTASREALDRLVVTIDKFMNRLAANETEQAARDAQFERLLEWAREVSKKTGIPLKDL